MNCYIHLLPGRLRIRTDFLKKNELGAFSLRKGIYSLEGVRSVVISTITGSILIRYDILKISSDAILEKLALNQAIPIIDYKQTVMKPNQVTRVWVETKSIENLNIWPFVIKKIAQFALGSLDMEPIAITVLTNIVLPVIVEGI